MNHASSSAENGPVFISNDAVRAVMQWRPLIEALRRAYAMKLDPKSSPPRALARANGAVLRGLVSVPPGLRFMGAKIFGRGRSRGMNYLISLADQDSGRICALIDANLVTAFRTAATSALAVDLMAGSAPVRLGVIGSGAEAKAHVKAISAVREIAQLRVYSRTPANRIAFAEAFEQALGVDCTPVGSAREAAAGADIVVAAARSHDEQPLLYADDLDGTVTVVSVGSTLPEQREVDVSVVAACELLVFDAPHEVIHESGDMLAASTAGVNFENKVVSLNSLVRGEVTVPYDRRIMYKSVGSALQDIVAAEHVYEKAVAQDLAAPLPIAFAFKQ